MVHGSRLIWDNHNVVLNFGKKEKSTIHLTMLFV